MWIIRINPATQMPSLSALAHDHDARLIENRRTGNGAIGTHQLDALKRRRSYSLSAGERDQAFGHPAVADLKVTSSIVHDLIDVLV
jgi:hypothetical protein